MVAHDDPVCTYFHGLDGISRAEDTLQARREYGQRLGVGGFDVTSRTSDTLRCANIIIIVIVIIILIIIIIDVTIVIISSSKSVAECRRRFGFDC